MKTSKAFGKNLLHLVVHEHILHLEKNADLSLNVSQKALNMRETINKVITIANSSPNGEITVVFTNRVFGKKENPLELLINSTSVSFFNTEVDRDTYLTKTVIFVDNSFSENVKVFRCPYTTPLSYLKEDAI